MADNPVAAELRWLKDCAPAIAASPESFDLDMLMPRYGAVVAAVEAALERHQPVRLKGSQATVCGRCRETWPCGEVQAITAELLGKENDHG
jgi:hypothetical protein